MQAFLKTDKGLFKAYRHGLDWQIVGPGFERWFSVWQHDVMGSLMRALDSAPGQKRDCQIVSMTED
jgi:hypothetical protein